MSIQRKFTTQFESEKRSLVLLCDVRFERIARRTELLTEGADETLRAEVLGLYVIADCAGIAGGVVTV
jgi:hypothetical protein